MPNSPPDDNQFPAASWSGSPERGEDSEELPQVKGYEIVKKLGEGGGWRQFGMICAASGAMAYGGIGRKEAVYFGPVFDVLLVRGRRLSGLLAGRLPLRHFNPIGIRDK